MRPRKLLSLGPALFCIALAELILLPSTALAEMTATYTGCPCTAGNWPNITFNFTNNAAFSMQLKGFRFKTPSHGGYSCFGGGTTTITGSGPYQYQQTMASWDEIRPVGSTLNTYSCGGNVGVNDGTPYDLQLLVKTGACNQPTPVATATPVTCAQVPAIRGAASYYSSTCIPDTLGKNGGPFSGGLIDNFNGQTQIQVGLPTGSWSESGTNVTFDPSTMGGPMYMMASAMGQEYLSIDMQLLFGVGSKESFAAMRQVPGGALFIPTNAAGVNGTYHVEVWTLGRVIMSYPNFFPRHACSAGAPDVTTAAGYACVSGDGGWTGVGNYYMCTSGFGCPYIGSNSAQLVNSVFAGGMNFWWIYDALSLSTNLCFNDLLQNGVDKKAAAKILLPAYNLGINSGFEAAILPASAAQKAAADISPWVPAGNSNYRPEIMTTIANLEAASSCGGAPIYDARITQTDLQNFFFGNGGTAAAPADGGLWRQFPSLYSSSSNRTTLWNEVLCAFNALKGLAPTAGLTANEVSYRYDFLTLLRVAKQYLNLSRPYPTQSDFTSWVNSRSTNPTACGTTIDNTFPSLAITSPAQGANVCPGFTVSGTSGDNVGVVRVEWTMDPAWLAWTNATGTTSWNFSVPGSTPNFPAAGALGKLWVRVSDACGNSTIQQLDFRNQCGTPTYTNTPSRTATPSPTGTPSRSATPTSTRTQASPTSTVTPSPTASPSRTATSTPSATASASPSSTSTPSRTATATSTRTQVTPTSSITPTSSATATRTVTPSASPSATPTLSATATQTRTATPSSTQTQVTPTSTITPTATATSTRTASATPSRTATATATPSATSSASPSATATLSATATATRSATPTATLSYTASPPASNTASPTLSPTPTASPSPSRTSTATATPTATPSQTATPSPTLSATATSTRSATPTATLSHTASPPASDTASPTISPTPTASASGTPSRTATPTPTATPTATLSHTASPPASDTASPTISPTPTASASGTPSRTPTPTPTATPTATLSYTASPPASATASPTNSPSPSASPSASSTRTSTPTPTASPTSTASPTPSATSSASLTPTATPTATSTHTPSPPASATNTSTSSPSPTSSRTSTASPTVTATPTATRTYTATRTATLSATITSTRTPSTTPSASATITPTPSATPIVSATATTGRYLNQEKLVMIRGLYPNPFREQLHIYFTLRVDAEVKLRAYNVAGEPIAEVGMAGKAGKNDLVWDGSNKDGSRCASGVYLLRLEAKGVDHSAEDFWDNAVIAR